MSEFKLSVAALFDGINICPKKTMVVKNGYITQIKDCDSSQKDIIAGTLMPGFIDVQVNGGGGYLFNQSPDLQTIEHIGRAHQNFGTTGWLPTLVTDSFEQMQKASDAVAAARANQTPGVLGIHFEGPYLSTIKKGVHAEHFIREISQSEINLLSRTDLGKVVLTLAPENVTPEIIAELVAADVIVCLGHSNASFEQTMAALKAGATGFTHLFNAMSAFTSREPGMVGAALVDQNSFCGLILDGVHVHPGAAKLAINAKQNVMLVTDAMPPVGVDQNSFEFFGQQIKRENNRLTDSRGRLAGSVLDMITAVNNCVSMLGLELTQAINLASINPATFLGIGDQYGSLAVGKKASMVVVNNSGEVTASWIDGLQIF